MKQTKKVLSLLLIVTMMLTMACSKDQDTSNTPDDSSNVSKDSTDSDNEADSKEDNEQAGESGVGESVETPVDMKETDTMLNYDGELILSGLASEMSIPYNDIYKMESVETTVKSVSSSGEESEDLVKGVLLNTILEELSDNQSNYTSIRFIAEDGYEVSVPAEIIAEKDIILAYEFNGEILDENKMPLRVAINDVRSMYFVSNLVEIEFTAEALEQVSMPKDIVFLETAIAGIPSDDFMYYDSNDKSVLIKDLIDSQGIETTEDVEFLAVDLYEKTEDIDIVKDGFIKYTGEDAPLFTGLDTPKGMNVKSIMKMVIGNKTFISIESMMFGVETSMIGDVEGIRASDLVVGAGLEASNYQLVANDGYSVEVTGESMEEAVIYLTDENTAAIKFAETYPKNISVKNLMTIIALGGTNSEESSTIDTDSESSDNTEQVALEEWTVLVEGLSDGSFEMTSERAGRKLEMIDLSTNRMKNDEYFPEEWKGYKVLDILDFLHVEDFTSLEFVAGDGYVVEIMKDQIDGETILAVVKDGEAMTGDNKVQLVQNTEFATTWVKGLVKIIVK